MYRQSKRLFVLALCISGLLANAADGIAAAPTITSFSPFSATLSQPVTINGTNFVAPATVTFNGVAADAVTVVSSTRIVAALPLTGSTGKITVTTSGGTAVTANPFTVVPGILPSSTYGPPGSLLALYFSGFGAYEVVDIYFDTGDIELASASGTGTGNLIFNLPANAPAGSHWLTGVGRHTGLSAQFPYTVRADWSQFGFGPTHLSDNPYENTLSTSNVANLQEAWRSPRFGDSYGTPAVVAGTVYVGFGNGTLRAFDEGTGAQKWVATLGSTIISSPAVFSGTVYIGTDDQNLYALDAATGAVKWHYSTGGAVRSSPTVRNGYVYFGSFDGSVYALNAGTGALVWKFTTGSAVFSSPATAYAMVYIGSNDNSVYALNAATGAQVWKTTTGAGVPASPLVVNGLVFVGSHDKTFYALNPYNGAKVWSYAAGGPIESTAAYAAGSIYFGSDDGKAYALSAATGALRWSTSMSTGPLTQGIAVANGVVYAGDSRNTFALDAVYGDTVATFPASTFYGGASILNGALNVTDYLDGVVVHYTLNAAQNLTETVRPEPSKLRRRDQR